MSKKERDDEHRERILNSSIDNLRRIRDRNLHRLSISLTQLGLKSREIKARQERFSMSSQHLLDLEHLADEKEKEEPPPLRRDRANSSASSAISSSLSGTASSISGRKQQKWSVMLCPTCSQPCGIYLQKHKEHKRLPSLDLPSLHIPLTPVPKRLPDKSLSVDTYSPGLAPPPANISRRVSAPEVIITTPEGLHRRT